ncbi:DUF2799 domain-containing protein [Gilvimarinus sp. DA14]|uniref:DUF2799 domain-containing protein n=1 Tax=Gilvimarinus sp. DA14 TaxID=2956798 RepID=UPI0020B76A10|nr:DUF2799 domain-containing protein [Gilvimarinus sp. DA14]UTF60054.1 DUF2799 domain-containing protein [Gilvimarinus sp. DA14]
MRLTNLHLLILAICSVITSGCATLDQTECETADWYLIGFEDGSRGYDSSRIRSHRQACSQAQITPQVDEYLEGLKRGYRDYCVANKGYQLGAQGGSYNNVCPADLAVEFAQAFQYGRDLYRINAAVGELEQRLQNNRSRMDELYAKSQDHEEQLLNTEGNTDNRRSHLNAIKANEREMLQLEESSLYAERELAVLRNDQQQMEQQHQQQGYFR